MLDFRQSLINGTFYKVLPKVLFSKFIYTPA